MAIVMEEGARRKGAALAQQTVAGMRARIIETFERQQSAFYTSGLLLDDGVIDPRDTRRVVALALSLCDEAARRALRPLSFGVARM
jgi:geranyl-CoA carboxylase beta subunit